MIKEDQFAKADQLFKDGDYRAAFKLFLSLAKMGDASAMTRVALMCGEGQGAEYSFEESLKWDMKAAEAGNPIALLNLGITYRRHGDAKRAREWFEKALQGGDGEAALELAKMYMISDLETPRVKNYLQVALASKNMCEASREEAERLLDELKA